MLRLSLRPGDWLVLIISVALVLFLFIYSLENPRGEPVVRIEGEGAHWLYPLAAELEFEVPGPLGNTHVHIHDGSVWISESPCSQKVCIASGRISSMGTFIACLPNRVLVRIEGKEKGEIDGLAF